MIRVLLLAALMWSGPVSSILGTEPATPRTELPSDGGQKETTPKSPYFADDEAPAEQPRHTDVRSLFFKTVFLLIVLCGLAVGSGFVLKKITKGRLNTFGADGAIRVVERKYLSPKTSLWLVTVHDQPFIVVDNQNSVAVRDISAPTQGTDRQ